MTKRDSFEQFSVGERIKILQCLVQTFHRICLEVVLPNILTLARTWGMRASGSFYQLHDTVLATEVRFPYLVFLFSTLLSNVCKWQAFMTFSC